MPTEFAGIHFALSHGMLRLAGRAILIGFALTACAACIKARQPQSPTGLTRDLQRNLSLVNVAATRRRGAPKSSPRMPARAVATGRPTSPVTA